MYAAKTESGRDQKRNVATMRSERFHPLVIELISTALQNESLAMRCPTFSDKTAISRGQSGLTDQRSQLLHHDSELIRLRLELLACSRRLLCGGSVLLRELVEFGD